MALPNFGMRTIQYWDKQACTAMEWNEQAAHFLYMGNLETLRTVYDRAAVGKEEGASVGDCTLNLR